MRRWRFWIFARTVDGSDQNSKGTADDDDDISNSLVGCGTDGGQMAVLVNASDPLYQSEVFVQSGLVNTGILIKVVRNEECGEW